MKNKSYTKICAGLALSLVLGVGLFSALDVKYAHAETSNTNSSAHIEELQKTLESLLQKLIELLTNQFAVLSSQSKETHTSSKDDCATSTTNTKGLTELEATVYTNETLIKVEYNGAKDIFTTSSTSTTDIVQDVLAEYADLTLTKVQDMLNVHHENRASKASDKIWSGNSAVTNTCNDDAKDSKGNDDHDSDSDNGHSATSTKENHGDDDDDN
ncbi:hypothetical protein IPJ70_01430 [Candidatus Campbellbacteria bacterium]|nr:MAG: hypothetical protein IPJ70_01430 [Candidatus Campbellbacteria bacterium]